MPYWLAQIDKAGTVTLYPPKGHPPFNTYLRAKEYEDNNCLGDVRIIELPSRDRSTVVGMLKARRIDQFSSVQKGMRKFRHPKLEKV